MSPVSRRAVPFADIELIAQPRDSAMRWGLSEGTRVEVWRGTQLLGTLSGETLRQLVAQHLSTMALAVLMHATLTEPAPDVTVLPRALPPRPVPSKDILTQEGKAARRTARRARPRKPPKALP